jgi:hypothetical protein
MTGKTIPPGYAMAVDALLGYAEQAVAGRVLAKRDGGKSR